MRYILALIMFLFVFAPTALAVGVSVEPSRIDISSQAGATVRANIQIKNISSSGDVIVKVYPENYSSEITVTPSTFTLSNPPQNIELDFNPSQYGKYDTFLDVIATPSDAQDFSASAGIKIPIYVSATAPGNYSLASIALAMNDRWWFVLVVISLVIFFTLFKIVPRR